MCLKTDAEHQTSEATHHGGAHDRARDGIVLKFGSSVLRSPADLPAVVSEIYRYTRQGLPVVAVVSAFAGETDVLIREATLCGAGEGSRHAPRFIALGEERAASLLAIACDAAGLNATIAGARRLQLQAAGPVADAIPQSVDSNALRDAVSNHDVVITPGFVAIGPAGEPVLLGRGGSDLTAVVLADDLGFSDVTLLKDVDGVYDRDPAEDDGAHARRYKTLDWDGARAVAGALLQPKAIDFAEARGVAIRVARMGVDAGTRVGDVAAPPVHPESDQPLKVAVAGLGVIGGALVRRLLNEPARYTLTSILVSDGKKTRDRQINPAILTTRQDRFFATRPDVVIDALSSGDAGLAILREAAAQGVSSASANKQAVAADLDGLRDLATANGAQFLYSAAVGGGAPMVETVRRAVSAGAPTRFRAVLNGTVNYILTALQRGATFESALKAAQDAGFAETDPSADLSGADAVAKIKILSAEAFGAMPQDIAIEALTIEQAREYGASKKPWRQVAEAWRTSDGAVEARLSYAVAPDDDVFATLDGEENAMVLEMAPVNNDTGRSTDDPYVCADFYSRGRGAGPIPTVESILGDLGEIERAHRRAEK